MSSSVLKNRHLCPYCSHTYARKYSVLRHIKIKHGVALTSPLSQSADLVDETGSNECSDDICVYVDKQSGKAQMVITHKNQSDPSSAFSAPATAVNPRSIDIGPTLTHCYRESLYSLDQDHVDWGGDVMNTYHAEASSDHQRRLSHACDFIDGCDFINGPTHEGREGTQASVISHKENQPKKSKFVYRQYGSGTRFKSCQGNASPIGDISRKSSGPCTSLGCKASESSDCSKTEALAIDPRLSDCSVSLVRLKPRNFTAQTSRGEPAADNCSYIELVRSAADTRKIQQPRSVIGLLFGEIYLVGVERTNGVYVSLAEIRFRFLGKKDVMQIVTVLLRLGIPIAIMEPQELMFLKHVEAVHKRQEKRSMISVQNLYKFVEWLVASRWTDRSEELIHISSCSRVQLIPCRVGELHTEIVPCPVECKHNACKESVDPPELPREISPVKPHLSKPLRDRWRTRRQKCRQRKYVDERCIRNKRKRKAVISSASSDFTQSSKRRKHPMLTELIQQGYMPSPDSDDSSEHDSLNRYSQNEHPTIHAPFVFGKTGCTDNTESACITRNSINNEFGNPAPIDQNNTLTSLNDIPSPSDKIVETFCQSFGSRDVSQYCTNNNDDTQRLMLSGCLENLSVGCGDNTAALPLPQLLVDSTLLNMTSDVGTPCNFNRQDFFTRSEEMPQSTNNLQGVLSHLESYVNESSKQTPNPFPCANPVHGDATKVSTRLFNLSTNNTAVEGFQFDNHCRNEGGSSLCGAKDSLNIPFGMTRNTATTVSPVLGEIQQISYSDHIIHQNDTEHAIIKGSLYVEKNEVTNSSECDGFQSHALYNKDSENAQDELDTGKIIPVDLNIEGEFRKTAITESTCTDYMSIVTGNVDSGVAGPNCELIVTDCIRVYVEEGEKIVNADSNDEGSREGKEIVNAERNDEGVIESREIVNAESNNEGVREGKDRVDPDSNDEGVREGKEIVDADSNDEGVREGKEIVDADSNDEGVREGKEIVIADSNDEGVRESEEIVDADSHDEGIREGKEIVNADRNDEGTREGKEIVSADRNDESNLEVQELFNADRNDKGIREVKQLVHADMQGSLKNVDKIGALNNTNECIGGESSDLVSTVCCGIRESKELVNSDRNDKGVMEVKELINADSNDGDVMEVEGLVSADRNDKGIREVKQFVHADIKESLKNVNIIGALNNTNKCINGESSDLISTVFCVSRLDDENKVSVQLGELSNTDLGTDVFISDPNSLRGLEAIEIATLENETERQTIIPCNIKGFLQDEGYALREDNVSTGERFKETCPRRRKGLSHSKHNTRISRKIVSGYQRHKNDSPTSSFYSLKSNLIDPITKTSIPRAKRKRPRKICSHHRASRFTLEYSASKTCILCRVIRELIVSMITLELKVWRTQDGALTGLIGVNESCDYTCSDESLLHYVKVTAMLTCIWYKIVDTPDKSPSIPPSDKPQLEKMEQ